MNETTVSIAGIIGGSIVACWGAWLTRRERKRDRANAALLEQVCQRLPHEEMADLYAAIDKHVDAITAPQLHVTVTGAAYDGLQQMAKESGQTPAEVILDALRLERWVREQQRKGAKVVSRKWNGDVWELAER